MNRFTQLFHYKEGAPPPDIIEPLGIYITIGYLIVSAIIICLGSLALAIYLLIVSNSFLWLIIWLVFYAIIGLGIHWFILE